jgi:hypothetical protein
VRTPSAYDPGKGEGRHELELLQRTEAKKVSRMLCAVPSFRVPVDDFCGRSMTKKGQEKGSLCKPVDLSTSNLLERRRASRDKRGQDPRCHRIGKVITRTRTNGERIEIFPLVDERQCKG